MNTEIDWKIKQSIRIFPKIIPVKIPDSCGYSPSFHIMVLYSPFFMLINFFYRLDISPILQKPF